MLYCVKRDDMYQICEITPNGDHSLDIAEESTIEKTWMGAAKFLNEKVSNLRSMLDEGMWNDN